MHRGDASHREAGEKPTCRLRNGVGCGDWGWGCDRLSQAALEQRQVGQRDGAIAVEIAGGPARAARRAEVAHNPCHVGSIHVAVEIEVGGQCGLESGEDNLVRIEQASRAVVDEK